MLAIERSTNRIVMYWVRSATVVFVDGTILGWRTVVTTITTRKPRGYKYAAYSFWTKLSRALWVLLVHPTRLVGCSLIADVSQCFVKVSHAPDADSSSASTAMRLSKPKSYRSELFAVWLLFAVRQCDYVLPVLFI